MKNVLVTYASLAGSTAEVASVIAEELEVQRTTVKVLPLEANPSPAGFDGVVLGGPMIVGWHRQALRFLKQQRATWEAVPLALFVTAMKLTEVEEVALSGFDYVLDPGIMQPPSDPDGLSIREKYSKPSNCFKPILQAMKPAVPVIAAIFGGRLLFGRLPWWAVPIALLAAGGQAGDRRDWDLIRAWAADLPAAMGQAVK